MNTNTHSDEESTQDQLTLVEEKGVRNRFDTLLARKGWRQIDLANKLSVDKAYVCRVANGHQIPPLEMRIRIARLLDTDSGVIWRKNNLEVET